MQSELENLQITAEAIENLTDGNLSTMFAIPVCQAFIFGNSRAFISVLLTELFTLGLLLIFILPIGLMAFRNFGGSPKDIAGIVPLLIMGLSVALLSLSVWNIYLWKLAQRLKSLVRLLNEVERYNSTIQTLTVLDQIGAIGTLDYPTRDREDVLEVLRVTKQGLMQALQVEKLLRERQSAIDSRYELFAQLEANLTELMTWEASDRTSECGHLFNEALQIGISVHREVRSLQKGRR